MYCDEYRLQWYDLQAFNFIKETQFHIWDNTINSDQSDKVRDHDQLTGQDH